nr:MAG TPA: Dppa2/4 conserved region [Caudoviricetes sp.]
MINLVPLAGFLIPIITVFRDYLCANCVQKNKSLLLANIKVKE